MWPAAPHVRAGVSVRPLDSPLLGLKPPWDERSRPALGRGTLPPSPRPLERWARGDPADIPAPLPGASLGLRTGSGELPADSWRTVGLVGAVYDPDSGPHAANGDSVWLEAGTPAAAGQPAPDSELGRGHRTSRGLFPRGEPSWGRERGRTGPSARAWRGRPWLLPRLAKAWQSGRRRPGERPPRRSGRSAPGGGGAVATHADRAGRQWLHQCHATTSCVFSAGPKAAATWFQDHPWSPHPGRDWSHRPLQVRVLNMPGLRGHRARPNPSLPCHRAKQAATARVRERLSGTCGGLTEQ